MSSEKVEATLFNLLPTLDNLRNFFLASDRNAQFLSTLAISALICHFLRIASVGA